MKQRGSQLQPNDATFSVVNFQAREQPQLQRNNAAILVGCPTREVLGSSAYVRQSDPQWQQKNAAFSVDEKHQTWGKDFEKEISQGDKEKRSGIHEMCKEFGRMFREKL